MVLMVGVFSSVLVTTRTVLYDGIDAVLEFFLKSSLIPLQLL